MYQTDADGNTIFYPWGILSKGFIVPDEATKKRINTVTILSLLVILILFSAAAFIQDAAIFSIWQMLVIATVLAVISLFFYQQVLKSITSRLTPSTRKARLENFATNALGYAFISQTKWLKVSLFVVIANILAMLIISLFTSEMFTIVLLILAAMLLPLALMLFLLLRYKIIQDNSAEEAYCVKEEAAFTQPAKQMPITAKNVTILLGIFGVVVASLYGYYYYETQKHNKRMAHYRSMRVNDFAAFLAAKNSKATSYDKQLYFTGSEHHGKQVVLLMHTPNIHALQKNYSTHFIRKLCHSHAFYAFFKKGGEVRYEIRDSQQDAITFTISNAQCN